jgi:hypothetical protein
MNGSLFDLQELNRGDTVRIATQQENKEWEKGVVKNKHSERSYEVQKENGRFIRRNRKYLTVFLKKVHNKIKLINGYMKIVTKLKLCTFWARKSSCNKVLHP